jgi:formylglycine-generating enzyme required for sulfatase activity
MPLITSPRYAVPVVIVAIFLMAHLSTVPPAAAQTPNSVEHNADWTPVFQTFDVLPTSPSLTVNRPFFVSIRGIRENAAVKEINVRSGPNTSYTLLFKSPVGTANLPVLEVRADVQNANYQGKVYQWLRVQFPDGQEGWVRDDLVDVQGDGTDFGYPVLPQAALAFGLTRDISKNGPVPSAQVSYAMALVPAGCFMMGSEVYEGEKPIHQQCVDQPFWIDRTEVTNAQYGSHGAYTSANRPRENVTWFEARDFCAGRGGRLPTEAEWEFAARGPDSLVYPWGDKFVPQIVVSARNARGRTANVGSQPNGASWVGAFDMSGNVAEWVSTRYQLYPYLPDDGREVNSYSADEQRVLRGGGFGYEAFGLRSAFRIWVSPSDRSDNFGFRCARDYE